MSTIKIGFRACLAGSAVASMTLFTMPGAVRAGKASSPAIFSINDSLGTRVTSDAVGSSLHGTPYTNHSLTDGDPCVDAYAGTANTLAAMNWSETAGWDCDPSPRPVRRFTLMFPVGDSNPADGLGGPCEVLFLQPDPTQPDVCSLVSGPPPTVGDGREYGMRGFRIRLAELFHARSTGTRVDFLVERPDPITATRRSFEIRTDRPIGFSTVAASTRTVLNDPSSGVLAAVYRFDQKSHNWVAASSSFELPFEMTVQIP